MIETDTPINQPIDLVRNINNQFGDMDLELLDLILKGHFPEGKTIMDVGCGEGRNLVYFFQNDYDVYAIDREKSSVDLVRYMAKTFHKTPENIKLGDLEHFEGEQFDSVLCSRVLHFSEAEEDFLDSWMRLIKKLKKGGVLYLATDSMIGFDDHVKQIENAKWKFKDGSIRFLLGKHLLKKMKIDKYCKYIEPIKTIHYDDQHAQTILCLRKL